MYWLNGMPKCRLGYSKAGSLRQKKNFNFICPIKFLFLNLSSQSRWHMKAPLFLFQKGIMIQNTVRIDWATGKSVESLFLVFLYPLSVPALLYPSLHFGMPYSQYITYQGPQYLILKRRGVGLCWVKGI